MLRVSVWLQCLPLALGLVSGFSECCCETCEVSGFTDTSQVLSLRCQAALARLGDQSEAGTPHLALLALSGVSGGVGLCLGRVLCLGVELSPCELQAGQARHRNSYISLPPGQACPGLEPSFSPAEGDHEVTTPVSKPPSPSSVGDAPCDLEQFVTLSPKRKSRNLLRASSAIPAS